MRAWLLVVGLLFGCGAGAADVILVPGLTECPGLTRGVTIRTDANAPCEKLRTDLDYAFEAGASFQLWPIDWSIAGWTLEAVGEDPLPPAWTGLDLHIIGITDLERRRWLVTTANGEQAFRSCLVHEMLHARRGAGHCHWAQLAPMFAVLGDEGSYYDECEKVTCSWGHAPGVFICTPGGAP
jgi:hypothetical protein